MGFCMKQPGDLRLLRFQQEYERRVAYFQGVLKVPYAFQVAVEGEYSGINPFDDKGRSVRISAADLLSVLI